MKNLFVFISVSVLYLFVFNSKGQVPFPCLIVENITAVSSTGATYEGNPCITSPSNTSKPVYIGSNAVREFKAGNSISLEPGFHASAFTGPGNFHAYIQQPGFEAVIMTPTVTPGTVELFEKLEVGIQLPANITTLIANYLNNTSTVSINPFDPDKISIEATFTSPSGTQDRTIYGFYYYNYSRKVGTGWEDKGTDYPWRIRFAPTEVGDWNLSISIISPSFTTLSISNLLVTCTVSATPNPGYLTIGNYNYLKFSGTGKSFFPVGQCLYWPADQTTSGYDNQLGWLSDLSNKGNYTRVTMCVNGYYIERQQLGDYRGTYDGSAYVEQESMYELDKVFEQAHSDPNKQLYIHLAFDQGMHYVTTSTYQMAWWGEWDDGPHNEANPYSTIPGVTSPIDFFTNSTAINYYKKRLRYIIARFGYSTNLAVYEFFNELRISISGYDQSKIDSWHNTMAGYIKGTLGDYNHLITDSYCYEPVPSTSDFVGGPEDFNVSDFDITNMHAYYSQWVQNEIRYDITKSFMDAYPAKPFILSEAGHSNVDDYDRCSDISLHNAIWSTAFVGGFGSAIYNNFDITSTFRSNFTALNSFMSGIDFESNHYTADKPHKNTYLEVFNLRTTDNNKLIGWAHNVSHYWGSESSCNYLPIPYPGDDPNLGNTVAVPYGSNVTMLVGSSNTPYFVGWYSTPHSGNTSLIASYTVASNSSGIINIGSNSTTLQGLFQSADDYAFKINVGTTASSSFKKDSGALTVNNVNSQKGFFNVYPNPNNGSFILNYSLLEKSTFRLFDAKGTLVETYQLSTGQNTIPIDNLKLHFGIYYYQVISNNTKSDYWKGKIVVME